MAPDLDPTDTGPTPVARRTALRTLGAAAVGGMAGLFALNGSAGASTGTLQFGTSNDAGTSGTTLTSSTAGATLTVDTTNTGVDATAIRARSIGPLGCPVVAEGGRAQLLLAGTLIDPYTIEGDHTSGELLYDQDGNLWLCVSSGFPGSWRRLGGADSAGAFHAIAPSRVYDSRRPTANRLSTGESRGVYVGDKVDNATGDPVQSDIVPARATAISYTLTVVGTQGSNGYLAVNPGNISEVSASTINWSAPGLTLANSSVVGITKFRDINVICGGTATSCNFIIDVLGYYL